MKKNLRIAYIDPEELRGNSNNRRNRSVCQTEARRISLAEAQRLAIDALLEAEERRRDEREREAAFWNYLELLEN